MAVGASHCGVWLKITPELRAEKRVSLSGFAVISDERSFLW